MNINDQLINDIIPFLRTNAQHESGWRGAAFGALLGAAIAYGNRAAQGQATDPETLLTGAAMGAAFGALDHAKLHQAP